MPFESDAMLPFYHYLFHTFHISLILFNVFGWILRRTARWNLITLATTGLSWTLLGAFYGFGYCPLTDWHYSVLERLGRTDLPPSYIAFLVEEITSIRLTANTADWLTGIIYMLALIASIVRNMTLKEP
jgi:hypothetical protein